MHRAQSVCRMRCCQDFLERVPQPRAGRRIGRNRWEGAFDLKFCLIAKRKSMARQKMERAKDHVGIVECCRLANREHSILNQKFRIRKARAQLLKLMMDGQSRCRYFLQQANADMVHRACVTKVNTRPINGSKRLCTGAVVSSEHGRGICDANLPRSDGVLGFPRKSIVVAIATEM